RMKGFRQVLAGLLVGGFLLMPFSPAIAGDPVIKGGGNVGMGLVFGGPGAWGASGKLWIDKDNALQPGLQLGNGATLLQLDYLFHSYDMVHPKTGLMPLYIG